MYFIEMNVLVAELSFGPFVKTCIENYNGILMWMYERINMMLSIYVSGICFYEDVEL
jgi:hypothetical protein